jgi:hypothetical protein
MPPVGAARGPAQPPGRPLSTEREDEIELHPVAASLPGLATWSAHGSEQRRGFGKAALQRACAGKLQRMCAPRLFAKSAPLHTCTRLPLRALRVRGNVCLHVRCACSVGIMTRVHFFSVLYLKSSAARPGQVTGKLHMSLQTLLRARPGQVPGRLHTCHWKHSSGQTPPRNRELGLKSKVRQEGPYSGPVKASSGQGLLNAVVQKFFTKAVMG